MVSLVFLCRRRPELTRTAYGAHLVDRHVPLALQHHRDLLGYAVHVVTDAARANDVDSVNVLTVPTVEGFLAEPYTSVDGAAAVTADHARFLAGADGYAAVPRVQVADTRTPGTAATTRWIVALRGVRDGAIADLRDTVPGLVGMTTHAIHRNLYGTGVDWDLVVELAASSDATARLDGALSAIGDAHARWTVASHVARPRV